MHVQSRPTVNEEVDVEELCAKLQAQVAGMERECVKVLHPATEFYYVALRTWLNLPACLCVMRALFDGCLAAL
jgi:hypothetical protein